MVYGSVDLIFISEKGDDWEAMVNWNTIGNESNSFGKPLEYFLGLIIVS